MSIPTQLPIATVPQCLTIEQAFNSVWKTLYAHVISGTRQAEELKIQLSETLEALASEGVTERQELRRKALESMVLTFR